MSRTGTPNGRRFMGDASAYRVSYQSFALGAAPVVAAAIVNWGMIGGLIYNKTLACVLLLLIFALRHRHALLVKRAMVLTASAYTCVTLVCLWKLLS